MSKIVALLVAFLAAGLAIFEMGAGSAQSTYITHNISLSDDWNFFQAKNARAVTNEAEADILASLPNASDPAIQARIKAARDQAMHLRDDPVGGEGMKQLRARAEMQTELREEAHHRYHALEAMVGLLQIAIVLASVCIVTGLPVLAYVSFGLGVVAVSLGTWFWVG